MNLVFVQTAHCANPDWSWLVLDKVPSFRLACSWTSHAITPSEALLPIVAAQYGRVQSDDILLGSRHLFHSVREVTAIHSFTTSAADVMGQTRTSRLARPGLTASSTDVAASLVACLLDEVTASGGNVGCRHRLAPHGGPDQEVVVDGMYRVSVTQVFHRPNRVSNGLSEILSVRLSIVYHKSTTM